MGPNVGRNRDCREDIPRHPVQPRAGISPAISANWERRQQQPCPVDSSHQYDIRGPSCQAESLHDTLRSYVPMERHADPTSVYGQSRMEYPAKNCSDNRGYSPHRDAVPGAEHVPPRIREAAIFAISCAQYINNPPKHVTQCIGEEAKLECVTDLSTHQLMRWEFNGHVLYSFEDGIEHHPQNQDKYEVVHVRETFILVVKDLQLRDGGIYTCRVTKQYSDANLIVLSKPEISKFSDNKSEPPQVIYTCAGKFGGPPTADISPEHLPKLRIFLDGKLIVNEKNVSILEHTSGTNEYTLRKFYNTQPTTDVHGKKLMCELHTDNPEGHNIVNEIIDIKGFSPVTESSNSWKIAVPVVICLTLIIFGVIGGVLFRGKWKQIQKKCHQNENDSADSSNSNGHSRQPTLEHPPSGHEDNLQVDKAEPVNKNENSQNARQNQNSTFEKPEEEPLIKKNSETCSTSTNVNESKHLSGDELGKTQSPLGNIPATDTFEVKIKVLSSSDQSVEKSDASNHDIALDEPIKEDQILSSGNKRIGNNSDSIDMSTQETPEGASSPYGKSNKDRNLSVLEGIHIFDNKDGFKGQDLGTVFNKK